MRYQKPPASAGGFIQRIWRESNPRHTVPETVALSPELQMLIQDPTIVTHREWNFKPHRQGRGLHFSDQPLIMNRKFYATVLCITMNAIPGGWHVG